MDIVLKPVLNLPQKNFKPEIGSVTCKLQILFALYLGTSRRETVNKTMNSKALGRLW